MERLRRAGREVADRLMAGVAGRRRSKRERQDPAPAPPASQRARAGEPSQTQSSQGEAGGVDLVEGRHAFLQALMKRGLVPEDEALALQRRALGLAADETLPQTISALNADLVKLHLRVKKLPCPVSPRGQKLGDVPVDDRREFVCVVNTAGDAMAKISTDLSFPELAFFKEVVTLMACDPEEQGRLSSTLLANVDVVRLVRENSGLRPEQVDLNAARLRVGQKEALLKRFTDEGWLMQTPGHKGFYSLGVRTLMELRNFLLSLDLPEAIRADWEEFI